MKNVIKNIVIFLVMTYFMLVACGVLPRALDIFNVLEPWP